MKTSILSLLTFLCLVSGCSQSNSDKNKPVVPPVMVPPVVIEPITLDYQKVIDEAISETIPGIILLVETPEKRFIGSAGVSNVETGLDMQVDDTMPTASAGKKMVALLAAQLADEGLLNLDDTLDTWLSEDILSRIVNSQQMTLRQLLSHTSGVANYVDVDDGDAYLELLLEDPEELKTSIDFVELAFDQPAFFLPGEGSEYSNTGFELAALVMDEVLGEHHSKAMRNRFFDPMGMTSTYYKGIEASLGDFVSGYLVDENGELVEKGALIDAKPFLINAGEASSPVISSVDDMAIFLKALITDDSFANDNVKNIMFGEDNLITVDANEKSGLGIYVVTIDGQKIYAHAGLTYGYMTQSIFIEDTNTSIVLFSNCGDGGINVCSTTFDGLIETVLENEL
jgi:D-alanyl-D-alanine carboxypeptidase